MPSTHRVRCAVFTLRQPLWTVYPSCALPCGEKKTTIPASLFRQVRHRHALSAHGGVQPEPLPYSHTATQCLCHRIWQGVSPAGDWHHAGWVSHRSSQYVMHSKIIIKQTVTASDAVIAGCVCLINRRYPSKETDHAIFAAAH